jgi:hypothetical protein
MEVKGSEAQGRRREASSEGSAEQNRDLTYRNRIGGHADRASRHKATKPISIKGPWGKSGRCAGKAVKLTSGGLHRVWDSRLRKPRGFLTAMQKSAEGVVPASERPARHSSERRETAGAGRGRDNREGPNGPPARE